MRITLLVSFLLCYCYCIYITHASPNSLCLEDQQSLLLQFRNNLAFDPEYSFRPLEWNKSAVCCSWSGVTCDKDGHIIGLDLSYVIISGGINSSSSLFSLQHLQILYLSGINFNSSIPSGFRLVQNLIISSNLDVLDLRNNQLLGSIPQDIGSYLSSTIFLSLSNNNLHGSIPDSLCKASKLRVLDISVNNISGTISPCLMTMTGTLEVLNFGKNNLTGLIPDMFPIDCVVSTLNFHGNLLHGPIPNSLSNCSSIEVFDIGSNQIVGGFPCFLLNIPAFGVLVLRNNKFHGSIECSHSQTNEHWKMIQIVDIAFNSFNGKLPEKYFTTWDRMIHNEDDSPKMYYEDSVTVSTKGQQLEFVKILTILTVIDFSSNHFEGPIPEVLMDLKGIRVLNLSNNALYGEIPSTIGNLQQLESLDLSNNSLVGEIPVQIASLSFLSYLNLSMNHLVGMIPTGETFFVLEPLEYFVMESLKLGGLGGL
ncbi:hypothetical protein TSUD_263850 [Trifolium subterraneum]|uniref:Leucine-rich repeat-containing N-terminal plant-type domain-containing protein n=1 Tax=Trifolium subterraneum TaxID=3900 RepID=A0A2Z6NNG3_TRISU|nr:hypothetical protein TSUD_263850 [Trifolium subterraneum]